MIISVDGKAKAGKSTLISGLSEKTGWPVFYTGDMFRSIAITASENPDKNICTIVDEFCSNFIFTGNSLDIKRNARIDLSATELIRNTDVFDKLKKLHKQILLEHLEQGKNLILDGGYGYNSDHPEYISIFITASDETRLNRLRYSEYGNIGRQSKTYKFEESKEILNKRDEIDKVYAPWRYAPVDGAVLIDTTGIFDRTTSVDIALSAIQERAEMLNKVCEYSENVLILTSKAYPTDVKPNSDKENSPSCDCG